MAEDTNINMGEELNQKLVVYKNFAPEVVFIDVARLKNILRDYDDNVKKTSDWVGVLALVISLILANCTASFREYLGLPPETWKAIFVICMIASVIWLIVVVVRLFVTRKKRSIEYLIGCIKKVSKAN